MPRNCCAHYVKEGMYDWNLRITLQKPKGGYKQFYLPKKEWTLDQVKLYRNKLCKEYEENGSRSISPSRQGGRILACNLGMN